MVRPPQYPLDEGDSMAVARAKHVLKELTPEGRAYVLAWLVKYYNDNGGMYSPQITQQRRRVTIDDQAFWLVKIPTR